MGTSSLIDLANPDTFANGLPHDAFAALRAADGLMWNPMPSPAEPDDGFWAVTRQADVVEVSRDTASYSSALGHIQLYSIDDDALQARASMIDMDPPMHTRLRRLVSSVFTPRRVLGHTAAITDRVTRALDNFERDGGGDWVELVAKPIPIGVICDILGVPEADHGYMIELTDYLVEGTAGRPLDPTAYGNTTDLRLLPFNSPAAHAIDVYARRMGAARRAAPNDDLISRLVTAQVEGEALTEAEVARFFQLMVFAGNETTRSTMSQLALALVAHRDQFERVRAEPDLLDGAVEELLRWASAIMYFRRTATVDTELAGTKITAGDKVVMWYAAANFDETVFDEPRRFDVSRSLLPAHVTFGGGGAHFCLGASLARLELRILIQQVLQRKLVLEPTEPAVRVRSNFVNGLERARFSVRRVRREGRFACRNMD